MAYTFTLKYQLTGDEGDLDAVVERLGQAGCDDALVGIGKAGRLALEFTREASSAEEALHTALADVRSAVPSAVLIEAKPDLVGLSDVAGITGMSRQNMRQLMLAHPASFPPPVHAGSTSIWHLADVLGWLDDRGDYTLPAEVMDVARATLRINAVKEARRVPAPVQQKLEPLIAPSPAGWFPAA